jgi:hypothetical protein
VKTNIKWLWRLACLALLSLLSLAPACVGTAPDQPVVEEPAAPEQGAHYENVTGPAAGLTTQDTSNPMPGGPSPKNGKDESNPMPGKQVDGGIKPSR